MFPYLNGEDLNSRPDQSPSRWVINFFDWPLNRSGSGRWAAADDKQRKAWLRSGIVPADYPDPVAADYPELLEIVQEKVKPERDKNNRAIRRERWWQYAERAPALYATIEGMSRVLAISTQATKYVVFGFSPTEIVFSNAVAIISEYGYTSITLISSSIHDKWTQEYTSLLETRIRYTPVDCFETFPFSFSVVGLEEIGKRYHLYRQSIMLTRPEGLTKTYNRFHDPKEIAADIAELRRLHVEMDQAVTAAYGWENLDLGHGFHETKQGIRFTISEAARREVLDRLLALNHQRYAEEDAEGLHDKKATARKGTATRRRQPATAPDGATPQRDLFDAPQTGLFDKLSVTQDAVLTIHAYLRQHPGWHGKDAIINGSGCPPERWNMAIKTLFDSGIIERQGKRRGARYRLRVPE